MAAAVAQLLLLLAVVATLQLLFSPPMADGAAFFSAVSYHCDWCARGSTASLLSPGGATPSGAACGYGPTATTTTLGLGEGYYIAAASSEFFRGGQGCGACYQLRCRDRRVCGEDGVKVVVADVAPETANRTAGAGGRFLLGKDAFTAMAPNHNRHGGGMPADDDQLEVDFRRIPCVYKEGKNLSVRVEETSRRSHGHLAIRFLYQGGQTDIAAVDIARAAASPRNATAAAATPPAPWRYMTRRPGPGGLVWRTSRAPAGPLRVRLVVTAGSGGKWLRAEREVLPAEWHPGGVYDTGLRVTDVAVRSCSSSCGRRRNAGAGSGRRRKADEEEELR